MRLPSLVAAVDRALSGLGDPAAGGTLVVGLSGGADSVALLDALVTLSGPRDIQVIAAHLDHKKNRIDSIKRTDAQLNK